MPAETESLSCGQALKYLGTSLISAQWFDDANQLLFSSNGYSDTVGRISLTGETYSGSGYGVPGGLTFRDSFKKEGLFSWYEILEWSYQDVLLFSEKCSGYEMWWQISDPVVIGYVVLILFWKRSTTSTLSRPSPLESLVILYGMTTSCIAGIAIHDQFLILLSSDLPEIVFVNVWFCAFVVGLWFCGRIIRSGTMLYRLLTVPPFAFCCYSLLRFVMIVIHP
jgi:hypothetical protein